MKTLTAAQLRANRANSQKSTGPRTASGKQRSSLNAIKHGCCSQTIILPGEDAANFARFNQSLIDSLAPANALELSLVETLALTQLSINRIRAAEANLFALGHEQFADTIQTGGDQAIQSALASAKTLKAELGTLNTLSTYLQRNTRMYAATLKQLTSLQATRKAEENAELEQAVKVAMYHFNVNTPFTLAAYGFDCSEARFLNLLRRKKAPVATPRPPITVTNAA